MASTCNASARCEQRLTLLVTCLSVLMVQLDTTVVNLALHAIQTGLAASVSLLQWVVDAYNVVYATLILTGGTLGDRFGRRRWWATGVGIFGLGSLLCGLAPSPQLLVAGRALAGVGAALALPGSLAVLTVAYPEAHQRARAVSIWAGCNGLAIALGPTLGGLLVDRFGWRSIFFVVLPLVALSLVLARWVAESADPAGRRLDVPGQVLAMLGLGLLASGAIEGQASGWLSRPIVAALLGAVVALGACALLERRTPSPLVPLDVVGVPACSGALGVAVAMTFGMYGMLFLVPLYLQSVLGASATTAGLALIPLGLIFAVVSPLAGRLATHLGPRWLISGGMALSALGLVVLAGLGSAAEPPRLLLALGLLGLALGVQTGPLMAVAVASAPPGRAGLAAGLVNVARMLGATLGVAILGSLFATASGAAPTADQFVAGMRLALLVGAAVEASGALLAAWSIGASALQPAAPELTQRPPPVAETHPAAPDLAQRPTSLAPSQPGAGTSDLARRETSAAAPRAGASDGPWPRTTASDHAPLRAATADPAPRTAAGPGSAHRFAAAPALARQRTDAPALARRPTAASALARGWPDAPELARGRTGGPDVASGRRDA